MSIFDDSQRYIIFPEKENFRAVFSKKVVRKENFMYLCTINHRDMEGNNKKETVQDLRPEVVEVRPQVLECDVVRFQNNKEKWVAFVGLLDGYPYEIFTGLQDDEEGIVLPKTVTHGKIIKQVNPDGTKRYDFQFENKRGYKTTVEGLSEKFNPEYWNYAKPDLWCAALPHAAGACHSSGSLFVFER